MAQMNNYNSPPPATRDVNFFEDEDETDATKFAFLTSNFSGAYAELATASANLSDKDYLSFWLMTAEAGNTAKVGFGETTATEHEQLFQIKERDVWQKIYWDISKIPANERDGIRYIRVTNTGSPGNYVFFDNFVGNRFMTNPDGATINSTPNEYIQYRAIISTAKSGYFATLHNVQLEWNNGFKIVQTDANRVRLYNYTGENQELRLDAVVFGADLAEWYTVNDQSISAGDVVAMTGELDDYGVPILKKADKTSEGHLAGIISTKAGQTLGLEAEDRRLLALAGRVPVKIATDSAEIKFGDLLTSSETPGYAKKAGFGQKTVSKALESWSPNMDKKTILALVGNSIAAIPDHGDVKDYVIQKVEDVSGISYQVVTKTGEVIEKSAVYSKAVISTVQSGLVKTVDLVAENVTVTQKIVSPIADIGELNVSEKIRSPIIETTDLEASGTAKINVVETTEIRPKEKELTIDLSNESNESNESHETHESNSSNSGELAKIIIKGLQGKTVTTIDAAGNASFSGQVVAQSLSIDTSATVSGSLYAGQLQTNEASISGTLTAKEINAENINSLTRQLVNSQTDINDIQKLLADIRNDSAPDPENYQNLANDTNLSNETNESYESNLTNLTVSGNSSLYNLTVSGSILTGNTLFEQNSIVSFASELKLSALSRINFFDGAVTIAKDGTITTRGELIAQGGIKTTEIKPLVEDGQVSITNLATNNLSISNKYLEATTSASIISGADNFDLNGLFAPAIDTATASAGIAILPELSSEIIIYNNFIKEDSLIYLTPTSLSSSTALTVGKKEFCTLSSVCKPYFQVVTSTPSVLPVKFNWLIVN